MGAQTYLPVEILDYVETHAPPAESPYGISQRELAKALGYHPCSMSRPLDSLVREGLLHAAKGSVRDGVRKQFTYRLTEAGRSRLKRETREVPLLAGEIPPPPHPFLGRREELDQLLSFSREGGSVTFISGPPGMGKTALVSRHLRRVKQGRIPFWFTVRPASSPRQFVSALSHALSFLGAPQLAYYSQVPRPPVAREVADLTGRALDDRTLVAVIDDVQVAGSDLSNFLSDFVHALLQGQAHQFFVVSQEGPLFGESESVRVHHLTIGGLDRASAHDLTDRQGGLADRFESIYQSSLGSPLLLQLAVLNPGIETDASSLPSAVVKLLTLEEVRGVLPVVLANEPLPLTFVAESAELRPGRIQDLTKSGLLHRTTQGRVEILQVVRGAILERVGPSEQRDAHLRLASFYSRSHRPEAVRERFLHLVDGESWRHAAQLLAQQERVILRLGYSETLRHALRHLSSVLPKGSSKVRVLMTEATLLKAHSDYSDAVLTLRKALEAGPPDPRVAAECHLSVVDLLVRLRQVDSARAEFAQAQAIGAVSRRLQAFYELTEGRLSEGAGDQLAAQLRYQSAFELARRTRNIDLALEGIAAWARVAELQSGHDVALRLISEALPEARAAGRVDIVLNLLMLRARAYTLTGRGSDAEVEFKLVRSEAESLGYMSQLTYALSGLTALELVDRRWKEAASHAKQAIGLAERLGNDLVLGYTFALLCSAELREADERGDRGLLDDAIQYGERGIEVLQRLPPSDSLALAHGYLAEAYTARRDATRARASFDAANSLARKLKLDWVRENLEAELGPRLAQLESSAKATSTAS